MVQYKANNIRGGQGRRPEAGKADISYITLGTSKLLGQSDDGSKLPIGQFQVTEARSKDQEKKRMGN